MQTNPLYVSQLARHIKLPLVKTVQDHTEELFRHRTTLPPLNSTSAMQLHVRVKELSVWALYLRYDSSLREQRSPKRGGDWGCGDWGSDGDGSPWPASAQEPPGIHGSSCSSRVQRWPVWISCAGTTECTFSGRQPWVQWDPPGVRTAHCWAPVQVPTHRTVYKRLAQIMLPKESISNATNTLKPCYTLYLKDFSPLQLLWGSICYL